MFRKMPFILLAIMLFAFASNSFLSPAFKAILYAVSLSLKEFILFVLPFLIFALLFKAAAQLSKQASKMILWLLGAICLSNFISTLISYQIGRLAYSFDLSMAMPSNTASLLPAWIFTLPQLIGNDKAMLSGLLLGLLLGRWQIGFTEKCLPWIEKCISICLKVFLWIIPFFILGFVVKMTHDQVMSYIFKSYTFVFVLVACAVFFYIGLIFFCANNFNLSAGVRGLKNMFPAAIAGFGSMSSAAAMPLTILGTEKNSSNKDLARSIIPATVNVHLIGDCFAIPIFAFAVLKNFGHVEPAFLDYLIFAAYFILAKFSVAAVPGGGILVMLPILESTLGFNGEMLSLITALYILFDPIITSANVLGNGGFALVLEKASGACSKINAMSPTLD